MLLKIGKGLSKAVSYFTLISFIGTLAMMLLNCADVFMSKIFLRPITGAYEITQLLMLCTVMASYAYGQTNHTHINMGLIIGKFHPVPKYLLSGILELISTGIAAVLGYAAFQQAQFAMAKGTVTGALFIPWYPFYYLEGVCMFVLALVLLYDTIMMFAAVGKNEEIRKYVDGIFS